MHSRKFGPILSIITLASLHNVSSSRIKGNTNMVRYTKSESKMHPSTSMTYQIEEVVEPKSRKTKRRTAQAVSSQKIETPRGFREAITDASQSDILLDIYDRAEYDEVHILHRMHPSLSPTNIPTQRPSQLPTVLSSQTPSFLPSSFPSIVPTVTPSKNPSRAPSTTPTHHPSSAPSRIPTRTPSRKPSQSPSKLPTLDPTFSPTGTPSHYPSSNPSRIASESPSAHLSSKPSNVPSNKPSSKPSSTPTIYPTPEPSDLPSLNPSIEPTLLSSSSPSSKPSQNPTLHLSNEPSSTPTLMSSSKPSLYLSQTPTVTSSAKPSSIPSSEPSLMPSLSQPFQTSRILHLTIASVIGLMEPETKQKFQDISRLFLNEYFQRNFASTGIEIFDIHVISQETSEWSSRRHLLEGSLSEWEIESIPMIRYLRPRQLQSQLFDLSAIVRVDGESKLHKMDMLVPGAIAAFGTNELRRNLFQADDYFFGIDIIAFEKEESAFAKNKRDTERKWSDFITLWQLITAVAGVGLFGLFGFILFKRKYRKVPVPVVKFAEQDVEIAWKEKDIGDLNLPRETVQKETKTKNSVARRGKYLDSKNTKHFTFENENKGVKSGAKQQESVKILKNVENKLQKSSIKQREKNNLSRSKERSRSKSLDRRKPSTTRGKSIETSKNIPQQVKLEDDSIKDSITMSEDTSVMKNQNQHKNKNKSRKDSKNPDEDKSLKRGRSRHPPEREKRSCTKVERNQSLEKTENKKSRKIKVSEKKRDSTKTGSNTRPQDRNSNQRPKRSRSHTAPSSRRDKSREAKRHR